jgi:hypothetical protein
MGVSFCLRLKKNPSLLTENLIWERLDQLGVVPGTSLYFCMSEDPKNRPVVGFDVPGKWKRNYHWIES